MATVAAWVCMSGGTEVGYDGLVVAHRQEIAHAHIAAPGDFRGISGACSGRHIASGLKLLVIA